MINALRHWLVFNFQGPGERSIPPPKRLNYFFACPKDDQGSNLRKALQKFVLAHTRMHFIYM